VLYLGGRAARSRQLVAHFAGARVRVARVDPRPAPRAGAAAEPAAVDELSAGLGGRLLSQRFRMVECVRGAQTVGLLAGTLGVARHAEVVDALRRLCRAAGKACYTFLVGKPSAAKLGNFPEADVFVLVACPESSLLDDEAAAALARPVATPHEAFIALAEWSAAAEDGEGEAEAPAAGGEGGAEGGASAHARVRVRVRQAAREWSGRAVLDFDALLPRAGEVFAARSGAARASAAAAAADELGEGEDAAPSFSLVTGALSRRGPPRGAAAGAASTLAAQVGGGALVAASAAAAAAAVRAVSGPGSGAAYLRDKRAWRGLAYEAEGGAAPTVAEGRVGTAAGYAGEGGGGAGR